MFYRTETFENDASSILYCSRSLTDFAKKCTTIDDESKLNATYTFVNEKKAKKSSTCFMKELSNSLRKEKSQRRHAKTAFLR